jgi:hypothetical protein
MDSLITDFYIIFRKLPHMLLLGNSLKINHEKRRREGKGERSERQERKEKSTSGIF